MPCLSKNELLRSLPQVEEVLSHPRVRAAEVGLSRPLVVEVARQVIDEARQSILNSAEQEDTSICVDVDSIAQKIAQAACLLKKPSLRKVINASGVILHTNLGRSLLPKAAVEAVQNVAAAYSTLEYDPTQRARGSRQAHYERLICLLTGAQAALAVNNNAAAVLLILSEFAEGREAIVSRGELIEIGGSFRIPDIMRLSHAKMIEVGTTNKTHLSDYEKALSPNTALLLKVHPSNYRMIGFAQSVDIPSLRSLADRQTSQILVYEDLGSGSLINLQNGTDSVEHTVAESLKMGSDLVSFSGDKLLGGPQAGIIVGDREHIDRLKNNPMSRALRLDKMTIAALEATLRIYLDKESASSEIPTLRMLSMSTEELLERTVRFKQMLARQLPEGSVELSVVDEIARAGGGALPMSDIPSCAVQVDFLKGNAQQCGDFLISKREVPIITRIKKETILCDLRTVLDENDMDEIAKGFCEYFANLNSNNGGETGTP